MTARRSKRTEGAQRRAVNSKITDELREKLEAAAASAGRTLSAEIEARLEGSFNLDGSVSERLSLWSSSPETDRLLSRMRESIGRIEGRFASYVQVHPSMTRPLKPWHEHTETRIYARRAIQAITTHFMSSDEPKVEAALVREDGSLLENFDYGRTVAYSVLTEHGDTVPFAPFKVKKQAS